MHAPVGAAATWVLSNHDVPRHVTRYGRADTSFTLDHRQLGAPTDRALGLRRARAALLLNLALPGSVYLYQGEELGLEEVEDIPDGAAAGPDVLPHRRARTSAATAAACRCRGPAPRRRSASARPARPPSRGCRSRPRGATAPSRPRPATPTRCSSCTAARCVSGAPSPELGDGAVRLAARPRPVLAFSRGPDAAFACVVNLSDRPVALPRPGTVVLTSDPLDGDLLPPDTAVWVTVD